MKADFNPMRSGKLPNVSTGMSATNSKISSKMGAGSQMGPSIAKGYLVTGEGKTTPTGGKFAGASKAKMTKSSKGK